MLNRLGAVALASALLVTGITAQTQTPPKGVLHDITIKAADASVYTGTVELAIEKGKVTGDMVIRSPTTITGKVAGTRKDSVLNLDFPYVMTEQGCEGNVKMVLNVPAKSGPIEGTMEATGCGMEPGQKLTGTVEMSPSKAKKQP